MAKVTFTEQAARRLVRAMYKIERLPVRQSSRARRHVTGSSHDEIIVKVIGNVAGGEKYEGYVVNPIGDGTPIPLTGTLTDAEIGSVDTSKPVTILNSTWAGSNTHVLTASSQLVKYFPAIKSPRLDEFGRPVYIITAGFDRENCT